MVRWPVAKMALSGVDSILPTQAEWKERWGGRAVCLCLSWASSLPPTADPLGPTHALTRSCTSVHSLCFCFNEPPGFGSPHLLQPSRPHPEDPCPPPRTSDRPACSPSRTPRTRFLREGSPRRGDGPPTWRRGVPLVSWCVRCSLAASCRNHSL